MTRFLLVLFVVALSTGASGPHLGEATEVVVTGTGMAWADEQMFQHGCETFRLSAEQARAFLNRAIIVTGMEIHDLYDESPCFVKGTAKFRGQSATWKIYKLGIGYVELVDTEYKFSLIDEESVRRIEYENL
jgi:hypothetical protein